MSIEPKLAPAIVFDFSNVIAHFDYEIAAGRLAGPLGLDAPGFLARARAAGFAEVQARYESGRIGSEEFHREIGRMTGSTATYAEFEPAWADIFRANDSVHRVVEGLARAGYRLVLGSNTNPIQAAFFLEQFSGLFAHFHRLVLSHEVGEIKPGRAFYFACAEAAGRDPSGCIFVDDLAENVGGAIEAGMDAILYRDTPGLIGDLAARGIVPA